MTTHFDHGDPWQDRLSEYLDGLLSESETRALEDHLQSCDPCRTALAELRAVVERLRADRPDEVPEDGWARITSRLPTRIQHVRPRRGTFGVETRTLRRVTAAAAVTIAFVGGVWTGAALCLTESAWKPPGWMHLPAPSFTSLSRRAERAPAPQPADTMLDEWTPVRRSLSALDQQLADARRALAKEPGNESLERVVLRLTLKRNELRRFLDSAETVTRPSRSPHR